MIYNFEMRAGKKKKKIKMHENSEKIPFFIGNSFEEFPILICTMTKISEDYEKFIRFQIVQIQV